jgi:GNAT superfamily N-acetyltransferase
MTGVGFQLGEATAVERTARDRLTFEEWGSRLTQAQYLDRERVLRQTLHGQHDMRSWVLRLPNAVIAASCETFRLPLMPEGVIEVVATVYVDRALRGVKMASRLIDALIEARREAGVDGLVLFSEVGTDLYARSGFKLLPAPVRTWTEPPAHDAASVWLSPDDLTTALQERSRIRSHLLDLRLTEPLVDWHLTRARFYARTLGVPMAPHLGARAGGVQLFWSPDFKCNVLRILDATGPAGASIEPAIAAAVNESRALGLGGVELWDDACSSQLVGGERRLRADDVPMGLSFTPRGELFMGPLSRTCWA